MKLKQTASLVLEKYFTAFRDTLRPTFPPLTPKQKHQRPRHYILRNF
jgi:hypothetical protein